jgi:FkbM family methyltransferase
MTVVDIGANLGYYTLIASAHVEHVISFEPERENAELLLRTLKRNARSNVTLVQKGLGEKEETLTLAIHPDNKGKHTLLPINEKGVTSTDIPMTTLDAVLETLGVPRVDLIKIDIEGWEAKALRGAVKTLRASHPTIMFEFGPERIRAAGDDPLLMLKELEAKGYALFVIDEDHSALSPLEPEALIRRLPLSDAYVNILALPSGI